MLWWNEYMSIYPYWIFLTIWAYEYFSMMCLFIHLKLYKKKILPTVLLFDWIVLGKIWDSLSLRPQGTGGWPGSGNKKGGGAGRLAVQGTLIIHFTSFIDCFAQLKGYTVFNRPGVTSNDNFWSRKCNFCFINKKVNNVNCYFPLL